MQFEGYLKRWCELTCQNNARHIGRQRAGTKFSLVNRAKHDVRSWKDRLSIAQQEVQRGAENGNRDVDFPVRVFGPQILAKVRHVGFGAKSGQIHAFAVDLHGFG